MLKKWLHIFLSFWLINAVTYFHASSPADFVNSHPSTPAADECVKINTWSDCIIQSCLNDDDDVAGKAHKIKFQRRYIRARSSNDNIFHCVADLHIFYQHFKSTAVSKVNHYSIGVALLPSYYNFLFRLCPF